MLFDTRDEAIKTLRSGRRMIWSWNLSRASERHDGSDQFAAWRTDQGAIDFRGVDLTNADLCEADLSGVDFTDAKLDGANLLNADLRGADLSNASLSSSNLTGVVMEGTELANTIFHGALMGSTVLGYVDLSNCLGLDSVRHGGSSTVGVDTLVRSKGLVPAAFLRGCKVPEAIIELQKMLVE